MIDMVVAKAHRGVIGAGNDLPWRLPADWRRFKQLTTGGTVLMGRNTYESLLKIRGGPLPDRRNIVISTRLTEPAEGFEVYRSLEDALVAINNTEAVHIIGGAQLYKYCLEHHLAERIYLTEIDLDVAGDTYFPELPAAEWQETAREDHQPDDKNLYPYSFVTLEHKRRSV